MPPQSWLREMGSGLKFLAVFFLLNSMTCWGFVQSKNSLGKNIRWQSNAPLVDVYLNATNNDGISESDVAAVLAASAAQWNAASAARVRSSLTGGGPSSRRNDVYFSRTNSLGTGVLGVTSVVYDGPSGTIYEADIILNDASYNFSAVANSTNNINQSTVYLGDVLTHELGHLLGLGHSQTRDSSMVFSIFNGQHQLSDEDIAGVNTIYPNRYSGTLAGKVIGGAQLTGIFGANVQALSASTGEVVGSVFSEESGSFIIRNLPLDDTYYIYVSPLNTEASPPNFFLTANSNFCFSGHSYRGSFFSTCEYQDKGYPQGIKLSATSSAVNVGNVSIRCSFDTPVDYLDSKDSPVRPTLELDLLQDDGSVGNAVTGFFSLDEQTANSVDTYLMDLSAYTPTFTNANLDLKLTTQRLFSPLRATMRVTNADSSYDQTFPAGGGVALDTSGNPDFNLIAHIPLDVDPSKNIFTVRINAQVANFGGYQSAEVFPAAVSQEKLGLYFLIATTTQLNGGVYTHKMTRNYAPYKDNTYCADAPNTKALRGFTNSADYKNNASNKKEETPVAGCGSLDLDSNGPNSGTGSAIFGFFMAFMVLIISKKTGNRSV